MHLSNTNSSIRFLVSRIVRRTTPLAALALLGGCLSAPFQPPQGLVGMTKAPLSTEGNWAVGSKKGTSSSASVLGLYAWGDCSIGAAARNGGLTKVTHVDYEYTNFIGIWQEAAVIVYGE